jgi:hypothetical protein
MPRTINTAIEAVPLNLLKPHPRNVNQGDFGAIQQSIETNGFFGTIVANKRTGHILAGNHRFAVAKKLAYETVPVAWVDVNDEEELRILIADNRTTRLGIDNEADLTALLAELAQTPTGLIGTGFDGDDLDRMIADLAGPAELLGDPDEVPEPPVDPITKPGDIWILGNHRLLCGDSTANIEFGADCPTLFFDPPWDAGIRMEKRQDTLAFCDGQRMADIIDMFGAPAWAFAWDCVTSWYTANRPLKRMKLCLWYGIVSRYDSDGAHYGDAGEIRNVTNTRGTYKFKPDERGKHLSDVFSKPITQLHSKDEHKHSKPVDWIRMLIGNCTTGDIFDPFCGSGTTLIAAEQLGRTCYGMEISPAYCDVIVKRWETLTGKTARLEATNA